MKYALLIISCLSMVFITPSCNKDCGSPPPVPAITYDFPVVEGDYLVLSARGSDDLDYLWLAPDGTEFNGKVWEIGTVQRRNSGRYIVTASEGDCEGITNMEEIDIITKSIPCVPSQGSITIENASINTLNNALVNCGTQSVSGNYVIELEADEGLLTITFPTEEPPLFPRSYAIKGNPDYAPEDVVQIELTLNGEMKTYKARDSGFLYIRYTSSQVYEFFLCELPMYHESSNILLTLRSQCTI